MRREFFVPLFWIVVLFAPANFSDDVTPLPGLIGRLIAAAVLTFLLPGMAAALPLAFLGLPRDIAGNVMLAVSVACWCSPALLRHAGIFDPFYEQKSRRPFLLRWLVRVMDEADKRFFGRQKSGGWAGMIRALAAHYRSGDFFAGRMSLFNGRIPTLWPVGIEPLGQAVTFGMQGSGKSTGAAMIALTMHDGPTLTFDTNGELATCCYAARGSGGNGVRGRRDSTHAIDPTGMTKLKPSRYNPLHEIERETDESAALRLVFNLAEALIKNPGGEDSWCYDEAQEFVYGLIAYVLVAYPHERRSLLTVRDLLMEGDVKSHEAAIAGAKDEKQRQELKKLTPFDTLLVLMTGVDEIGKVPPAFRSVIAGQAATVQQMGDRQRGSVLTSLKSATKWLDLPEYRDAVTECDFYLSDFSTQQISLFVCVPLNELNGLAAGFVRLFLVMFTNIMYRAKARPKKTVLCLVDEFPQFGYIRNFCAIGPTMRKYGVKLWVLMQDLGQLKATYPKEWEGFIGCAAMVQYFALKHGETLDYMVRSLGERIVRERDPDTGRIVKRPYPLLDRIQAALFLKISDGNCIVVRYDHRPFRVKTAPIGNSSHIGDTRPIRATGNRGCAPGSGSGR